MKAIKIDVTSIDAYLAIAVPELWVYASIKLNTYLLQDRQNIKSDISPKFPNIPVSQIIPATIERSWQVGTVQALEELKETIAQMSEF